MRGSRTVMAFCIGYGRATAGSGQLPVLLACRAQTTAVNLSLGNFTEITCTEEADVLAAVSSNQLCLLSITNEMRQLVAGNQGGPEAIKSLMLLLWEKALPMLAVELYTYVFNPYRVVYKHGRIAALNKSFITPCRFSAFRPVLHFVLRIHKDHLSLSAALSINGREVAFNHKPELFSVDLEGGCYYLAQSVEADDHLNWMYARGNRLTILKEHFGAFHNAFLAKIGIRFPVYIENAGKLKKYNYEAIAGRLDT